MSKIFDAKYNTKTMCIKFLKKYILIFNLTNDRADTLKIKN